MAVPNSGQLRLRADINLEVNGNNTDSNVALHSLAQSAGFSTPDAMSDFYGYSSAVAPTVTSNNGGATDSSITARGTVNSDGGATITQRGFRFGTNSGSSTSNPAYAVSGTTGNFSRGFPTPASSTRYYWAYATNSVGTTFGSRITIATGAPINYSGTYVNVQMYGMSNFVGSNSNNTSGTYGYGHAYYGFNNMHQSGTAAAMNYNSGNGAKYRSGANTPHVANKQNQANTYFNGISSFTTVAQAQIQWGRAGARQYGNIYVLSNAPSYRLSTNQNSIYSYGYWRYGPQSHTIYSQQREGWYIS